MNYTIFRKINFHEESVSKQNMINAVMATIKANMNKVKATYIDPENKFNRNIDVVFSVGGDGSMMHSVNYFIPHSPIYIGINAGNVGFLTAYEPNDVFEGRIFDDLFCNKRIEDRFLIEYSFKDNTKVSANEIAIYPLEINQTIDFSMEIENNNSNIFRRAGTYQANALLLSTPIGSTAYNRNVGGAIIDPNVKAIQFALVASMNSGTSPIVFDGNTKIKIIANKPFAIYSDGIKIHEVAIGEYLMAYVREGAAKFLLPENWNYFNSLSKKLHWNNGKSI